MSSTLTVKVIEGRGLAARDKSGTSDPYCVVSFGSASKKTKPKKKTLCPNWSDTEPFIFPIDSYHPGELLFEIYDWNKLKADKRMGRAKLSLKDIPEGQEHHKWLALTALKERDEVSGELHVTVQYTTTASSENPGSSQLFSAIKNSDLNTIEDLLRDEKLDLNIKDSQGYTPLHAACCLFSERDDQILTLLLQQRGINVNITNEDQNTPLHYFCAKFRSPNCSDAFEMFIEKGANVNAQNNNGETPLHKAIFNNSLRILMVNLLIKAGADVNKGNLLGETPLHYAIWLRREDLVSSLLKGGADVTVKGGKENKTPYDLAVEQNHERMAIILKRAKDLYEWLEELQMGKYKTSFIVEEMYLDLMPDLDEKILDRMGITTTGHRLKLLKAAKTLKETQGSNLSSATTASINSATGNSNSIPGGGSDKSGGELKGADLLAEFSKMKYINKSGTWILQHSELEFTTKIGAGTAGTVYKGLYKNEEVAVKVLKTEQTQKELDEFKKEFQIMSTIQSPYIVFFFGAVLEPKLCMVMELCIRGSLYHVMNDKNVEIGWDRVFSFSKEMVKGMEDLHTHVPQILHRDFKSLNLMVNEQFHVKVGDFGLSRFNTDTQKDTLGKMRGTYAYCAPECYFGEKFCTQSDVFSIGVVLWELVVRCIKKEYQRPYQEFPNLVHDYQIIIQSAKKNLRPTIPPTTPEAFTELIKQCWAHEFESRPSCTQILERLEALEKSYHEQTDTWKAAIQE